MGGWVRFTSNMGSVEIVLLTPVYRRGVVVYPAQDHLTILASLQIYMMSLNIHIIVSMLFVHNVRHKCAVLPASR